MLGMMLEAYSEPSWTSKIGYNFIKSFILVVSLGCEYVSRSPPLHEKCPITEFFPGLYFSAFGLNTDFSYGHRLFLFLAEFQAQLSYKTIVSKRDYIPFCSARFWMSIFL